MLQRARKDEDKQERRALIISAVRQLCLKRQNIDLTVAEVANQAKLAKGTVYLYFKTKEEMLLALLGEELTQWAQSITKRLKKIHGQQALAARAAKQVANSLQGREIFLRLLVALPGILEHNIDETTAYHFKQVLLEALKPIAAQIEELLKIRKGRGVNVILNLHVLLIGLKLTSDPAPVVKKVLAMPQLKPLRLDFVPEFIRAATYFLEGVASHAT